MLFASLLFFAGCEADEHRTLDPWRPGFLDIHHISVVADCTLVVYPDGTTLLFDAGALFKSDFQIRAAEINEASVRPNDLKRPGEWYADYIEYTLRFAGIPVALDYALISHFDADHYGKLRVDAPTSKWGAFKLTGITDIAERISIGVLIDRGYPNYDFPVDLRRYRSGNVSFQNYLSFVAHRERAGQAMQAPNVGDETQVAMRRNAGAHVGFSAKLVKTNGTIWSPESTAASRTIFQPEDLLSDEGRFGENPLSLALLISYGPFDYFTGGDMTGVNGGRAGNDRDTETPVASVVGEVDVLALNHHGMGDATNEAFTQKLHPQVAIFQGRIPGHPAQKVVERLNMLEQPHNLPSLFGTYIHNKTRADLAEQLQRILAAESGHVVIRVYPPGDRFEVFVLDDSRAANAPILQVYGTYISQDS